MEALQAYSLIYYFFSLFIIFPYVARYRSLWFCWACHGYHRTYNTLNFHCGIYTKHLFDVREVGWLQLLQHDLLVFCYALIFCVIVFLFFLFILNFICILFSGSLTFLAVREASDMGLLTTIQSNAPESFELASDMLSVLVCGPGSSHFIWGSASSEEGVSTIVDTRGRLLAGTSWSLWNTRHHLSPFFRDLDMCLIRYVTKTCFVPSKGFPLYPQLEFLMELHC